MKCLRSLLLAVTFAVMSTTAFAGHVRILNAAGDQSFLAIQSAVDAAADGDVLLVADGSYAAFVVDGKQISILVVPGSIAVVHGTVKIRNVNTGNVVLCGLTVAGDYQTVLVTNCAGHVWFRDCVMASPDVYGGSGEPGAWVSNSAHVVFAACTIIGGNGGDNYGSYQNGWSGGDGLFASQSHVALYDCTLRGGRGGTGDEDGGAGGSGCDVVDQWVFLSRCNVQGGDGGNPMFGGCGPGGHGITAALNAIAYALDDQIIGGLANCGSSHAAPTFGNVQTLSGARSVQADFVHSDQSPWTVHAEGLPGDSVYLIEGLAPGFRLALALLGVRLVPSPVPLSVAPLGVIPAAGFIDVDVTLGDLPAGEASRRLFLQGLFVDAQGHVKLAGPLPLVLLNRDSGPDCNGNGIQDYVEIIEHTTPDVNANLVPDACDNTGSTWYVDANAPPGGNGTAAAPFRTIGQALALAQSSHTILVADGVYTGPENRNLDFTGRDISLRSSNGPAQCVIDCQAVDRAFEFHSGETHAALVQGFQIANGHTPQVGSGLGGAIEVKNASPTIEHCVITSCYAAAQGGGISLTNSNAIVRLSTIAGNTAPNTGILLGIPEGFGGGISQYGGNPQIYANWIENNTAAIWGGGAYIQNGRISHCVVRGNQAQAGAGVAIDSSGSSAQLDDLLIAGNIGGGVFKHGSSVMTIANCTLVANQRDYGSAIEINAVYDSGDLTQVLNSVVWSNPATSGFSVYLAEGADFVVQQSDVDGGPSSVYVVPNSNCTLTWGGGNVDVDPAFVDPVGPDGDPLTVFDNDYHLSLTSRCIDSGDNSLVLLDVYDLDGDGDVAEPDPIDLDAQARFADVPSVPDTGNGSAPIVDMGCYERQP